MGLIQTPEQLRFSYQAIIEGAKNLDPDASPTVSPPLDKENNNEVGSWSEGLDISEKSWNSNDVSAPNKESMTSGN